MVRIFFSHNNFFNGIISAKKTQIPPDAFMVNLLGFHYNRKATGFHR